MGVRRSRHQDTHATLRSDQLAATAMCAIATATPIRVITVALGAIERIAVDDQLGFATLPGDERPLGGLQTAARGQFFGIHRGTAPRSNVV